MGRSDDLLVGLTAISRRVQCQANRLDRTQPRIGRRPHDQQREHQAHTEDGDHDADGEEHPPPEQAHPAQDRRVDDRVVERQRDLQDAEDQHQEHGLRGPSGDVPP